MSEIAIERIAPEYVWRTRVATTDVGPDRLLTPAAQLRFQQEAGELHFGAGGLGFEGVAEHGLAFVIVQNNCRIVRRPAACEEITVRTWSRNVKGAKFYRCYRLEDAEGNVLIDSVAVFVLVDVNSHEMLRPSQFPYEMPHCPDKEHTCPDPARLRMPADAKECGTHTVRLSELDFNAHLNNTRYADIVFDCLPAEAAASMDGFSVAFVREAKGGDTLTLTRAFEGGTWYVQAQNGDNVCFTAQVRCKG
ncbi:MAG: hypothetical protein IJC52_04170 [Clostridia bacterium]|nr:hypothetical protein [Clostridia bacterium]